MAPSYFDRYENEVTPQSAGALTFSPDARSGKRRAIPSA
jgi:hypothetical protein